MTKFLLSVLTFISLSVFAQTTDEMYRIIERKLLIDKNYLDIYAFDFTPDAKMASLLPAVPLTDGRGTFNFKSNGDYNYRIVFKYPDLENDSIVLLYILEVGLPESDGNIFGTNIAGGPDTNLAVKFKDLQELYFQGSPVYTQLVSFVNAQLADNQPVSLLGIDTREKEKIIRGMSSDNNLDFISFQKTNGLHRYPKIQEQKTTGGGRGRGSQQPAGAAAPTMAIDASLSALSFFHPVMDYGFGLIGVEANTNTPVVNVLPWRSQTVTAGVRALVNVAGTTVDPMTDLMIDAKLMGRFRLDMRSFLSDIPIIIGDPINLNVGSAFIVDAKTTGIMGMPFLNLYFAYGPEKFDDPFYPIGGKAYFTFTQWESTMSFFWNNSDKRAIRYKMDLGVGGFDVIEADYSQGTTLRKKMKDVIQPVVALSVNFVPNEVEFLGVDARYFDSHITAKVWLKLLELSGGHDFRVEFSSITASLFREPETWESKSSQSFVQLRYRYGF